MIPLNGSGERKLLVNWVTLETLADTGMNCTMGEVLKTDGKRHLRKYSDLSSRFT